MALGNERVAPLAVQVDVEDDDVDVSRREHPAHHFERVRLEHLVTVELEVDPAQKPDRRLIVDDEDSSGRRVPPGIPHRAESSGRQ
jgi:hypothetical protein